MCVCVCDPGGTVLCTPHPFYCPTITSQNLCRGCAGCGPGLPGSEPAPRKRPQSSAHLNFRSPPQVVMMHLEGCLSAGIEKNAVTTPKAGLDFHPRKAQA